MSPDAKATDQKSSLAFRIAAIALRTVFIAALLLVVVRVSMPQSETIWTAYETPRDLARMVLGLIVSIWIRVLMFTVPKDPHAQRTWFYLGLAAVPFILICLVVVWRS